MARITTIGCSTKGWDDAYYINDPVQRVLNKDPALRRLLTRKLTEHGKRLPKTLRLGKPFHTVVWKAVTHYRDGGFNVRAIVITTDCLPDGRLMTRVTSERGKFER